MIRHIVLFKFKPGVSWQRPEALAAEDMARQVGDRVPDLRYWYAGRNISDRPVAYDYVVVGLLADEDALRRYLDHPFHQDAIQAWREISDWVIADVVEEDATVTSTVDDLSPAAG